MKYSRLQGNEVWPPTMTVSQPDSSGPRIDSMKMISRKLATWWSSARDWFESRRSYVNYIILYNIIYIDYITLFICSQYSAVFGLRFLQSTGNCHRHTDLEPTYPVYNWTEPNRSRPDVIETVCLFWNKTSLMTFSKLLNNYIVILFIEEKKWILMDFEAKYLYHINWK